MTDQPRDSDIPEVGRREGSASDASWNEAEPGGDGPLLEASAPEYNGGRAWLGPDEDDDTTYLTRSR